jgi:hypothetical protein
MHTDGRSNAYCTRNEERLSLLEATKMASNRLGLCFATGPSSTVQLSVSPLSDVVTTSGAVDGGEIDKPAVLRVGQLPALAAVGRAMSGVVCAADIWEVGEIPEIRV